MRFLTVRYADIRRTHACAGPTPVFADPPVIFAFFGRFRRRFGVKSPFDYDMGWWCHTVRGSARHDSRVVSYGVSVMRACRTIAALVVLISLSGCGNWFGPPIGDTTDVQLRTALTDAGVEPLTKPELDPAKVMLGQALFFDKILSGNQNISCSTCHSPFAFTGDALPLSIGQGGSGLGASRSAPLDDEGNALLIPRNAPDVFNRGDFTTMFWDARVTDRGDGTFATPAGDALLPGVESALAAQAMFPVTSGAEMRGSPGDNALTDLAEDDLTGVWAELMARLLAIEEYRDLFAAAYPGVAESDLTFAHAANAIAAFEIDHWTLTDSPFDHYLAGDDSALSDAAKRGALLFYGEAGCSACHAGTLLTDESFHNRCVPQLGPGKGNGTDGTGDFGRENVTGDANDRFKFRTPPLRNVAATGPWMHSGAFTSLEAVVRHELDPATSAASYDANHLPELFAEAVHLEQTDDIVASAQATDIEPVSLTDAEVADLIAFLESLTSPQLGNLSRVDTPDSVPSGLPLAD